MHPPRIGYSRRRPAGTALRVLLACSVQNTLSLGPEAMILNQERCICSNDGVMVGPSHFQVMSKLLYRTGSARTPDEQSHPCCAKCTCHPEKTLHSAYPRFVIALRTMEVGCSELQIRFQVERVLRRYAERLHFVYGFGSFRTCVGIWSSSSRQDAGDGGGCGDIPKPLGWSHSRANVDGEQGSSFRGSAG